jgi:peptide/nickel transport system ATP-binding protein
MGTATYATTSILPEPAAQDTAPLVRLHAVSAWHAQKILHDVTLDIAAGRCTALVGESGSGKTTLARCIAGLHARWTGEIALDGAALPPAARQRSLEQLRRIQYVFQNPYASLNPRQSIGRSLMIAGRHLRREAAAVSRAEVIAVLASVGLPATTADALPGQLSPDLLICDEVTSALDVSIQATIVELLTGLRESRGLSILFVAHNIGLVRSLAQDVVVMQAGRIVESGPVADVLSAPKATETVRLMRDAPRFEMAG